MISKATELNGLFLTRKVSQLCTKEGNHKGTAKYDNRNNKLEEAYFDSDGKPFLSKDGYHKFTAKYDKRGNRTEDTEGGRQHRSNPKN